MRSRSPLIALSLVFSASMSSCGPSGGASAGPDAPRGVSASVKALAPATGPAGPACATYSEATGPLPGVDPRYLTLEYWLERLKTQVDLDQVLLTPGQVDLLNASMQVPREDYHAQRDLLAPFDVAELSTEVSDRRLWAREKLTAGEFVSRAGVKLDARALEILDEEVAIETATPVLRVALADAVIHCTPIEPGFFTPTLDLRLDRNACSALRAQDVVRVVAEWPNHMRLIQSAFSFGWLLPDVPLSPPIPERLQPAFAHGGYFQVTGGPLEVSAGKARLSIAEGTRLPALDKRSRRVYVATDTGFVTTSHKQAGSLAPTRRDLTRRSLLEEAWRFLGTPYGLGDTNGGRDCSRLLLDAFSAFDVQLPRHSTWQSQAGSFWIDVQKVPEAQRPSLFDAASKKGLVLLHFPGHIMLYLGRNERDEPMVLHALGEYVEPCPGRPDSSAETLVRVKNVTVSNLELGRGTSRNALLQRITRVTVIGGNPGAELAGVAHTRPSPPAAIPSDRQCRDSERAAIYAMPEEPNREQALRVVTAISDDPGPAALTLIDPGGHPSTPDVVRLGGPPFGQVATVASPKPGKWKAVLADGDDVLACQTIVVKGHRPHPPEPQAGPIWVPKHRWNAANESLFALFVERLFDYPIEEDRTWSNLHALLRDTDRNILFDYRGLDEDNAIELQPDCADLPYVLRSYFAWKMRLPFGYRHCTRGRGGKAPSCDEPGGGDNLMSRLELPGKGGLMQPRDDVKAFELFLNTQLSSAVHSSSGRTAPEDELTDFYPVALNRESLKPGTVFADPYGHLLVLAKWIPQGLDGTGLLVGVDAQPDGTVGQRRFWRGTFLFDPDTKGGGAGFKAFRPRTFVEEPTPIELPGAEGPVSVERVGYLEDEDNKELRRTRRFVPFSLQQYKGSADDFYSTIETLINPRPLDPRVALVALVDALREAVTRRVLSVNNGEKWAAEHPGEVAAMPESDGIFLSSGAWEDFSTPSRDLRLLIALDTVRGFVGAVRAAPDRYGIRTGEVEGVTSELEALLESQLREHVFGYTRSDGSEQKLSLRDVLARASAFEVAYNPNDCPEIRWGAPAGSAEGATCKRRAPPEQLAKLEAYRHWFSSRKRPPQ